MEEGKGFDHQTRVDLMTAGAIGRLLPKLGEFLLKQEHNLQTCMTRRIVSLKRHLWRMENALPRINNCVNELRELAYDIEDIVDDLMLCMDEGKQEVTQPIISQDSFSRETLDNMAAAAGAIGPLIPKLCEFLKQEHNLQTSMEEDIETQLRRIEDALVVRMPRARAQQDQDVVDLDPQDDKHWAYDDYELIRELAYDTEDIVDNLMLRIDQGKLVTLRVIISQDSFSYSETLENRPGQTSDQASAPVRMQRLKGLSYESEVIIDNLLLCINEGKQVMQPIINQDSFNRETLENIKVRVENLAAWRAANFAPTTTRTFGTCLEDGFKQVRQLVGIHKLRAELISAISSSSQQLKIVSIWGAGGMGKTALAKSVYENIKGNFHCAAFVSVGPQPGSMKKVLKDILIHLGGNRYSNLNMTMLEQWQIIGELQHFLANERCLIVIDDIRDIPSWESIKCVLVDSGCGSRIITTSRVLDVAKSSGEVLELMPLSIDSSKELFYATLCGREGTINFDQLDEQTTEYILQKCGCVPLAIIVIASLLGGKPQEEWTEVYDSIGFEQEDDIGDENNRRKIIQFSYIDLPSHLKTCLLYFSIFPEGQVIEKDMLVWRWVAEGFVHDDKEQGESLFKVGERYLYELVSRSMILLAVENEDTNICVCSVEGMVLDWIRTVAREENFVNVLSSGDQYDHDQHRCYPQSNNARIMAIDNRVFEVPQHLDGMWKQKLRSFNGIGGRIRGTRMLHATFLRVLCLEACKLTEYYWLNNLMKGLLHLRYLGLREMTMDENFLNGIGGLRFLQTLDLTKTYRLELPSSVTQLSQLKCLRCSALKLPPGMGNLTSLEELRLGVVDKSPNFADELSKLTELRVLHIIVRTESFDGKWMEASVKSLSKLQKIEELQLFCDELSSDVMTCRHVIAPGGFPKIRNFRTNIWLILQPGAMPYLKAVGLRVNVQTFKNANFDFYDFDKWSYLRLLERAHVTIVCSGAKMEEVGEAEAAVRHMHQIHPNRPTLILTRSGQCVDDKQIQFFDGLHDSRVAPQVIPLELLRQITNDFSEKKRLGTGTFGAVYKGVLNGKDIAVKVLHSMSQRLDYEEEFMKEFENLRRLDHSNIVQLLGYCYEIKRVCIEYEGRSVLADKIYRALCFEYMCNGSLQQHLDGKVHRLSWRTCYKIIKGVCEGLQYLHVGSETPMYHLDLKPGNILLGKKMVPKIADFGLSKFVRDKDTQATLSFLGTKRYCPPEYIEKGYVSNKFDIFSLGVVMIEIIAGPEGYCKAAEMPSQEFMDHVQEIWRERLEETSGTSLIYECCQVKRCIEIALECVSADRKQRPNIGDITSWLNELENNTERLARTSTSQNET